MMKVIHNETDYAHALGRIEALAERDPEPGTDGAEQLELLAVLVQDYEAKRFPRNLPDPVEAIKFRMEQQDLLPRDLVPFIGSRSKVSEVLSGKRTLSLPMIRALHEGLKIPAEVLLGGRAENPSGLDVDWERFPVREMIARGWIHGSLDEARSKGPELVREFFARLGSPDRIAALYRKSGHIRSARSVDNYALLAWTARVRTRALDDPPSVAYEPGTVDAGFIREVARLSAFSRGPSLAREYLSNHGISLVVEPHLPRTHLDGAALFAGPGRPVVGLTLRYDRLDSFWYCLAHELAHIALHLGGDGDQFYDDLDLEAGTDPREREADRLAGDALIPQEDWEKSPASRLRSPQAAEHLARQLGIHPAIVAGRIRHEFKSYRVLNNLVGQGQVRGCFAEEHWG